MPTVIINDVSCEAEAGERVLDVARRNALHVGFLCDGKGLCQTCISRVIKGEEHLGPLTEEEKTFMRESWRETGHRMTCQSRVQGPGPIEVLTRAEQMRREAVAIVMPPEGTNPGQNAGVLVNHIGRVFANQLTLFPANAIATVRMVPQKPIDVSAFPQWFRDAFRISQRLVTGKKPDEGGGHRAQKVEIEVEE